MPIYYKYEFEDVEIEERREPEGVEILPEERKRIKHYARCGDLVILPGERRNNLRGDEVPELKHWPPNVYIIKVAGEEEVTGITPYRNKKNRKGRIDDLLLLDRRIFIDRSVYEFLVRFYIEEKQTAGEEIILLNEVEGMNADLGSLGWIK